jgi:hypothetical protein
MKLHDLEFKKSSASKALSENYNVKFDASRMSLPQTQTMLKKIRSLMSEAKSNNNFYQKQTEPTYMKLVFMEQELSSHFNMLKNLPNRIVVENEEVEKSQVVLAAQDLVDSIQKMLEEVGQMQVKELPALVASIESEIGVQESQTYNEQVTAQLDTLSASLKEAFTGMKDALNTVTGQGGAESFDAEMPGGEETASVDLDQPLPGGGEEEMSADLEEPEELPVPGAGRARR